MPRTDDRAIAFASCINLDGDPLLRMSMINPRVDEGDNGQLLPNMLMSHEEALEFLEAVIDTVESIWPD